MKLNKRVLASAALSASLVGTAVSPVAWASDEHVNGTQEFGNGSNADSGLNVNDADNLQPNYEVSEDQTSQLGAEELTPVAMELPEKDNNPVPAQEESQQLLPSGAVSDVRADDIPSGSDSKVVASDEQQSGAPLRVNEVKEGDEKITGSVFLLPGQEKTILAFLPTGRSLTTDLKLEEKSGDGEQNSKGKVVTFEFDVSKELPLKAGAEIVVSTIKDSLGSVAKKDTPVKVIVMSAAKGNESRPEQSPDSGSGQVPGNGAEGDSVKPPASGENGGESQEKPQGPSDDAGEESENPKAPGKGADEDSVMPPASGNDGGENQEQPQAPGNGAGKESEKPKGPGKGTGEDSVKPPASDKDGGENQKKPQGPGNGAGKESEKPKAPGNGAGEKPGKSQIPGNGGEKGGSNFGAAFGVVAGVVAFVAGVVKFFNQFSGIARFLQPLRNFFSLFKF
jgi:intracellular motility protein A